MGCGCLDVAKVGILSSGAPGSAAQRLGRQWAEGRGGGCYERCPVFKGRQKKDTQKVQGWSGRWDRQRGRTRKTGNGGQLGEGRNEKAEEMGKEGWGDEGQTGSLWRRPQPGHRTP